MFGGKCMHEPITFIHAADLHLDSPFKGMANLPHHIFQEVKDSTFLALDALVNAAIGHSVDFVLIVGDLFDNEVQSLKAQIRLRKAFEKLDDHGIDVFLSYGNHDHINGNKHPMTYPPNVFIFPDETVRYFTYEKNGQPLAAIYGFSYENRAVLSNKTPDYNIADQEIPYHIATLHGSIGNNREHDVYAPFLVRELVERPFDYWALGHIHQREILKQNPPIVYPGNIQGRNKKESGEKGCYFVTLTKTSCDTKFIPLQAIQFNSVAIDVSGCSEDYELESVMLQKAKQQLDCTSKHLIDITLWDQTKRLQKWEKDQRISDIIDIVNEQLMEQKHWVYIYRYTIDSPEKTHVQTGEYFLQELSLVVKDAAIRSYISDLYQHKRARKYVHAITDEMAEEIKQEAKKLLINELIE